MPTFICPGVYISPAFIWINTVVMLFTFQTTTVNKCRCEILNECICIASMPVVNYYKVGS